MNPKSAIRSWEREAPASRKLRALFCACALSPAALIASTPAPPPTPYIWDTVPIGGCGYVTGIVAKFTKIPQVASLIALGFGKSKPGTAHRDVFHGAPANPTQ